MAWNDLASVVSRVTKGGAMSFTEYDANNSALNTAQAAKAPYALSSGKPIGLTGHGDAVYPAILRPIEILAGTAVAASSAYTSTDESLGLFLIPAGTIGANSELVIEPVWTYSNSANNKILKVIIGGSTVYSATRTTSVCEAPRIVLVNRNSLSSQLQPHSNDSNYFTAGSSAPATWTIDFSVDVLVQITGQRANSGDTLTLEYFRATHFLGA